MSTELCYCLWYFLSPNRKVIGVCSRSYVLGGSDAEKEQVLSALALSDHRSQGVRPPSRRLLTAFPEGIPYEAVSKLGVSEFFAEEFARLAGQMPPSLPVPEGKLFFAQPMFDFGSGFLPCEIGDGFVKERQL